MKATKIKQSLFGLFCFLFIILVVGIIIFTKQNQAAPEDTRSDPPTKSSVRSVYLSPDFYINNQQYVQSIQRKIKNALSVPNEESVDDVAEHKHKYVEPYISEMNMEEDRYLMIQKRSEISTTETYSESEPDDSPDNITPTKNNADDTTQSGGIIFSKYITSEGWERDFPFSKKMQEWTWEICEKYNVPYRIVLGIMGAETLWNENPDHTETHSGTKYIGIGCIAEHHHAQYFANRGIDIYTLEGNIEALCILIKDHYEVFGDITLAVMAYNGGRSYVRNKIADGVRETSYTKEVLAYAESLT